MHSLVRDLYKRIIHVGREYPLGLGWVRSKAKTWFLQNKDVTDDVELRRCVAHGRHMVREMQAVIYLKKYRHLKNTYEVEAGEDEDKHRR